MNAKQFSVMLVLTVSASLLGGMLAGLFLNVEFVAAQDVFKRPKVIEAQAFRLVDHAGQIRAVLEAAPDGTVGLVMGKDGIIRIKLLLDTVGNAMLDLTDEKGQPHATLAVSAGGSPSLALLDKHSLSAALLGEANLQISRTGIAEERPAGSLLLLNKDGRIVWRAP